MGLGVYFRVYFGLQRCFVFCRGAGTRKGMAHGSSQLHFATSEMQLLQSVLLSVG